MKKFLLVISLYLVLVFGITAGVNAAYVWVTGVGKTTPDWEKFRNVPQDIEICNFGSSHGWVGFDYESVSNRICFNFALGSQNLSYDYSVMQQYQNHLKEGGVVFLPISYFSFYGVPETEESLFESRNMRYYHFLKPKYVHSYSVSGHTNALMSAYLPAVSDPVETIRVLLGVLRDGDFVDPPQGGSAEMNMRDLAETAVDGHLFQGKCDQQGNRIINQTYIDSLKAMIALCRARQCRPILITTPFALEYQEEVRASAPGFLEEHRQFIRKLAEEEGVEYYDYAEDARFSSNHDLFRDADHLNETGAKLFTKTLLGEVLGIQE